MKKISLVLLLLEITFSSQSQVLRVATSPSTITTQVPGYSQVTAINSKTITYTPSVPTSYPAPVDGDSTTENDKVYEYADVIAANITMADGNITATSVGKVWTLKVNIPNALNIGLLFNQFNLSATAEMYVFNDARTALDSCIKKSHFTVSTSVGFMPMTGNSIIIYILEPGNFGNLQSSIAIQNVEAGYQSIGDVGDVGDQSAALSNVQTLGLNSLSDPCENATVNCDPLIQCQQDKMVYARAVALFSTNGWGGTGTLINNEANNGRAYFLTAFHVIDKSYQADLSSSTAVLGLLRKLWQKQRIEVVNSAI